MKKMMLLLLGLMAASFSRAAEERTFLLATAGEVNPALVEKTRAYMELNSGAVVTLAPAIPVEAGQSLESIGRAAAKTLGKKDHSIIVLAAADTQQPQGVCLPDVRFAVLNLARLGEKVDEAKLERRTGQEALRVMAMLLDMAPCPFPLCVLVGYEKTEDLDQMSGNFCPPCQTRFSRLAQEASLRLVEGAPEAPAAEEVPEAEPAAAE